MAANFAQAVSVWTASSDLPTPAMQENLQANVCIVGAGIAGLCTAYPLAREGRKVVVLNQDNLADAETAHTTAHLTEILDAAEQILGENINVAHYYSELLTPGELDDEADIPVNCGAVIRHGLEKHAVYRDENGDLHRFSAVCPHLNCIVHWNSAELSWDCPCHGSRYNRFGKVINGPSTKDLTTMID